MRNCSTLADRNSIRFHETDLNFGSVGEKMIVVDNAARSRPTDLLSKFRFGNESNVCVFSLRTAKTKQFHLSLDCALCIEMFEIIFKFLLDEETVELNSISVNRYSLRYACVCETNCSTVLVLKFYFTTCTRTSHFVRCNGRKKKRERASLLVQIQMYIKISDRCNTR